MLQVIKSRVSMGLILFVCALVIVPGVLPQQLSAPTGQTKNEYAFRAGVHPFPTWRQGYLVSWELNTWASDTAENLAVYDRQGNLVGKTRIWLPDTSLIMILDAAARADGNVAAVGWAMTSSGTVAGFLADVSVAQNSARIIQTAPFEGQAVTFGPDGTIWVFGWQLGPGRKLSTASDHYMLRHFGTDDTLKDQYLLRSSFPCDKHPAAGFGGGRPRVVASSDRIGLLAPACNMWLEFSLTGEQLGQWQWSKESPASKGTGKLTVRTVSLIPSNELYGWLMWPKEHELCRFDRKTSTWISVDTSKTYGAGAPFYYLLGNDGDALVYYAGDQKLAWATPSRVQ